MELISYWLHQPTLCCFALFTSAAPLSTRTSSHPATTTIELPFASSVHSTLLNISSSSGVCWLVVLRLTYSLCLLQTFIGEQGKTVNNPPSTSTHSHNTLALNDRILRNVLLLIRWISSNCHNSITTFRHRCTHTIHARRCAMPRPLQVHLGMHLLLLPTHPTAPITPTATLQVVEVSPRQMVPMAISTAQSDTSVG